MTTRARERLFKKEPKFVVIEMMVLYDTSRISRATWRKPLRATRRQWRAGKTKGRIGIGAIIG